MNLEIGFLERRASIGAYGRPGGALNVPGPTSVPTNAVQFLGGHTGCRARSFKLCVSRLPMSVILSPMSFKQS